MSKCHTCAKILKAAGHSAHEARKVAGSNTFKKAAVIGVGFGLAFFVVGAVVGRVNRTV